MSRILQTFLVASLFGIESAHYASPAPPPSCPVCAPPARSHRSRCYMTNRHVCALRPTATRTSPAKPHYLLRHETNATPSLELCAFLSLPRSLPSHPPSVAPALRPGLETGLLSSVGAEAGGSALKLGKGGYVRSCLLSQQTPALIPRTAARCRWIRGCIPCSRRI